MMANLFRGGGGLNLFEGVYFNGSTWAQLIQACATDTTNPDTIGSMWWRFKSTLTRHERPTFGDFAGFTGGTAPIIFLNQSGVASPYCTITSYNRTTTLAIWYATNGYAYSSGWHHVLWGTHSGSLYLYVDGDPVAVTISKNIIATAGDSWFDYTRQPIGYAHVTGYTPVVMDMAEYWYAPLQWIDITQESNRRKFIRADGTPEDMGDNGEIPLGVQPRHYLSLRSGYSSANEFFTNRGTGGNFTIQAGALSVASDQPKVGV